MKTNFKKHKQQGFTLLELGIVVTIALIVVGVAVTKVPKILADHRANSEISELPQIITNTQKAYANQQSYTGVTLDNIIRLDVFPQNYVTVPGSGAATATNRWNGPITFSAGTIATAGDIGRYVYSGVPASECKNVVLGLAQNFRRIYVDSANSGTAGAGTIVKADGAAVDPVAVGTACTGAGSSITFDFAK